MDHDEIRQLEQELNDLLEKTQRSLNRMWKEPRQRRLAEERVEQIAAARKDFETAKAHAERAPSDSNIQIYREMKARLQALQPARPLEDVQDEEPAPPQLWCSPCGYSFPVGGKCRVCGTTTGSESPLAGVRRAMPAFKDHLKNSYGRMVPR